VAKVKLLVSKILIASKTFEIHCRSTLMCCMQLDIDDADLIRVIFERMAVYRSKRM